MCERLPFPIIEISQISLEGSTYALVEADTPGERLLAITGESSGFAGEQLSDRLMLATQPAHNAATLCQRLPWLRPTVLRLTTSAGFGVRPY